MLIKTSVGIYIYQLLYIIYIIIVYKLKVLGILKMRAYPLDESLFETRSFCVRDASAYLLERNGAIDEAVYEFFYLIEEALGFFIR
jgi:hypothetical protein